MTNGSRPKPSPSPSPAAGTASNLRDDIQSALGIDITDEEIGPQAAADEEYWSIFGLGSEQFSPAEEARQSIRWGNRQTTIGDLAIKFYTYEPRQMELLQRILAIKGLYKLDKDELGAPSEATYNGYLKAITREFRKQKAKTPPTPATPSVSESLMPVTPTVPPETGTPRVRRKGAAPIG